MSLNATNHFTLNNNPVLYPPSPYSVQRIIYTPSIGPAVQAFGGLYCSETLRSIYLGPLSVTQERAQLPIGLFLETPTGSSPPMRSSRGHHGLSSSLAWSRFYLGERASLSMLSISPLPPLLIQSFTQLNFSL